jgi:hypothetical protein
MWVGFDVFLLLMQYKFCFTKGTPDAFPFNIVVLIFRYTVGERLARESGKITWAKKKHYVDIGRKYS